MTVAAAVTVTVAVAVTVTVTASHRAVTRAPMPPAGDTTFAADGQALRKPPTAIRLVATTADRDDTGAGGRVEGWWGGIVR